MLKLGVIDETGYMADCENGLKSGGFYLAPGVAVSGRDIRQFQLAKSAVHSGVNILCKNSGVELAAIRHVFIAGGLGFFINKQNAVDTGIFPRALFDALSVRGNLSLQGAAAYLTAPGFPERCKQIISRCTVIDLAADPLFIDEFAENMLF
jgi:uncharacterized 2Fe-2S/4Fe-4S cluster protein (DUF4445 family)